jgi:hypothetical protein
MHSLTLLRATLIAFLLIFLSACGGAEDQVTVNPNDPVEPEPSGLIITNANGLQTSLDEGNFTINAPGEIVANDTEITYEKLVLMRIIKLKISFQIYIRLPRIHFNFLAQ